MGTNKVTEVFYGKAEKADSGYDFFGLTGEQTPIDKIILRRSRIFAAFNQLALAEGATANTPLELEFNLQELEQGRKITVWLRNKGEAIQLKNTKIDTYLAGISAEEIESL